MDKPVYIDHSLDRRYRELIKFISNEKMLLNRPDDGGRIDIHLGFIKMLKRNSDEIPTLEDAEKEHKNARFEDHEFYSYYPDISDEMDSLIKILYAAYLFSKGEYRRAYGIITELNFETNDCYSLMFFVGKVFSLFEDKDYKKYLK